jgi:hypothetical protein
MAGAAHSISMSLHEELTQPEEVAERLKAAQRRMKVRVLSGRENTMSLEASTIEKNGS